MKNKKFKILSMLIFLILSFSIFGETYEEIMKVTRQELESLKINEKSIEKTFEGIRLQSTDFSKSGKPFMEAVELDSKNYLAWLYVGTYERAVNKNTEKAIENYEKAIKANPKNPRPYNNLAIAYRYLGDEKKADETVKKMISLFPEYPEGYYQMAIKSYNAKNYSESIKYAKQAIEKYSKIKKLDYWYITQEIKEEYTMDAQKIVILSYAYQNKLDEAIKFLKNEAIIKMEKNKYDDLNYIFGVLFYKNKELYEKKNPNLYKNNFDELKSIEFLGLLLEASELIEENDSNKKDNKSNNKK